MNNEERANMYDFLAKRMEQYARILRGEEMDMTGRGFEEILKDGLEMVLESKIVPTPFYEHLIQLYEASRERRG